MKRFIAFLSAVVICLSLCTACGTSTPTPDGTKADTQTTIQNAKDLQSHQPTPTDIDYSLERYNLIRRAYWVNGHREKAAAVVCPIEKPLGYVALITESGAILGKFVVDGKVSSLNSYLTPDSEYYEQEYWSDGDSKHGPNRWLADVDGSYGTNDNGIFFFTPDGKYVEWTGTYLYSDIPFEIDDPVLKMEETN